MTKQELTEKEYQELSPEDKEGYKQILEFKEQAHGYGYDHRVIYRRLPVPEPVLEAPVKEETLTMDKFFELATFSEVPIVNEYYKSIKAMHHNSDITKGIEEFAKWQKTNADLISRQAVIDILEAEMKSCPELSGICNHVISKIK